MGPLDVDVAVAFPERHRAAGFLHHPRAEIFVGDKEKVAILGRGIDDFHGVAAGDNHVALGLHRGAAIDVGNRVKVRIGHQQLGEFGRGATGFEGATGVEVGENDGLVRVNNLCGFGHEVNAAKDDDVGRSFRRLLRKAEGIAHIVGDVLDFGDLVIVREDDGVELFFEGEDFAGEGVVARARHRRADGVGIGGAGLDFGRVNHGKSVGHIRVRRNVGFRRVWGAGEFRGGIWQKNWGQGNEDKRRIFLVLIPLP